MVPPSALGDHSQQLLQQACAELRQRLLSGEDCRAEHFLNAHPELNSSLDHALELIYTEFVTRRELGQNPDLSEWLSRFPQWGAQLQRRLEAGPPSGDSVVPDPATVEQTVATIAARPVPPPRLGTLGRYELLAELGRGGMGVVYKARDPVLGRLVALKMIRAGLLAGPDQIQRFRVEAQMVAQFTHPHIVRLYEAGEQDNHHYFTMDFAPGGSLADHREKYGADPNKLVALAEKVARAVHYAHGKGILHRDLKPGNILLDERGEPLVSDFGLAKSLHADVELTREGVAVGTPAYMGPELIPGHGEGVTARSDVWALGVLLYDFLTGQRPFPGKDEREVFHQIETLEPARPRQLKRGLHRDLEAVVLKCLEKEPARRYASAEVLADDLARWQRGEPTLARPESWYLRTWRTTRHLLTRKMAVAPLMGALAVMAAVAYLGLRSPDSNAPKSNPDSDRPIILIGEKGPPKRPPHQWLGEAEIIPPQKRDGTFTVKANRYCLLEMVANRKPPFRFRAEVRHNAANPGGSAGIYFGSSRHPTDQGLAHCFVSLSFKDRHILKHPNGKPATYVEVHLNRDNGPQQWRSFGIYGLPFWPVGPVPVRNTPWRKLAVEVTAKSYRVFWQGLLIFETTSKALRQKFADNQRIPMPWDKTPVLHPRFTPTDALGLCLSQGEVSFRRVVVEPLH
jgi:serine/threonine protein kinase